jgi:uncharacterized protein YceK
MSRCLSLSAVTLVSMQLMGCGTISSFAQFDRETPVVYSGTRMDAAAIANDQKALAKFAMDPPSAPAVDLPFSVVADTVLLPGTLAVAAYRKLFW